MPGAKMTGLCVCVPHTGTCLSILSSCLSTWPSAQLRVGTDVCAQSMAAWSMTREGRGAGRTGSLWEDGAHLQMRLWAQSQSCVPRPQGGGGPRPTPLGLLEPPREVTSDI